MSQTTVVNVHEKIAVFSIADTHIWSGQRSNSELDFKLGADGKLPPKEARASLGTKNIVKPSTLSPFYRAKDKMVTLLQDNGVRYLGGYAVPLEKAGEIQTRLNEAVSEFNLAKTEFLAKYDALVDEWASSIPEYGERIRAEAPSVEEVGKSLQAAVSVFRVMPLDGEEAIAADENLSNQLFVEVNGAARALYKDSFRGKTEVTRRVFAAIYRLSEKLRNLSFLDQRALPMAEEVEKRLSAFGKHGPYTGHEFTELANIVLMLAMDVDVDYEQKRLEERQNEDWLAIPTENQAAQDGAQQEDKGLFAELDEFVAEPKKEPEKEDFFAQFASRTLCVDGLVL